MPKAKSPKPNIRCLIVEDDPFSCEVVMDIIKDNFAMIEITGIAHNLQEAEKAIIKHRPDIVLLDVELPDGNSFNMLSEMKDMPFQTIFITSHDNYAMQAFKYSAIDYILKPIDVEAFIKALKRAINRKTETDNRLKLEFLFNQLYGFNNDNAKIALPSADGLNFVRIKDIIRCQAESNYTHVHLINNEELMISRSLKEFEELLPNNLFYRVHKSHLINITFLKKYVKHDGGYVVLEDGTHIAVALRKKDGLLGKVNKFKSAIRAR